LKCHGIRGGSDLSAVALAGALEADQCEIYSDVDGIYTTDPRIEPNAKKLMASFDHDIEGMDFDERVCKVSVVGVGMKSHSGVAATAFRVLADANININMISTSEIKVSMVIDEKYGEKAIRALHKAYELDN